MHNTAKAEHRMLRFNSLDEILAEVDRLVAADRAGRLRTTGNWSLGQSLGHLAAWMDFPYDGYPKELKAPWIIRLLSKAFKKKFLYGSLKRGVKIPGIKGGTIATDPMPADVGAARLRRSIDRLRKTAPAIPNPLFGPMTHDEWMALHMRHAELHLGFLHPMPES